MTRLTLTLRRRALDLMRANVEASTPRGLRLDRAIKIVMANSKMLSHFDW